MTTQVLYPLGGSLPNIAGNMTSTRTGREVARGTGCHMLDRIIRLLVADDEPLLRTLLVRMLDNHPGIDVVGECENGVEAVARTAKLKPNLVLMDVSMPVMNGLEATRRLLQMQPGIKVLIYSGGRTMQNLEDAVAAGAVGYQLKDGDFARLVAAIRTVAAEQTAWPEPWTANIRALHSEPLLPRFGSRRGKAPGVTGL